VCRIPPVGPPRAVRWATVPEAMRALVRLRDQYDVVLVSGYEALGLAAVPVARWAGRVC
jgi:hypothetical protein